MTSNPNESRPCPLCGQEIPFAILFAPPKAERSIVPGCIVLALIAGAVLFFLARGCGHI
jgi:hypothetical protein